MVKRQHLTHSLFLASMVSSDCTEIYTYPICNMPLMGSLFGGKHI